MKRKIKLAALLIAVFIVIAGVFLNYGYNRFKISDNFTSIPLSFNPYDSTSTYNWDGAGGGGPQHIVCTNRGLLVIFTNVD